MATPVLAAGLAAAVLSSSADFFVSAREPARNFGALQRLVVRVRPKERAFVRFVLPAALRPGDRATLRLYALRDSAAGLTLRHASDGPWREGAVTYRSAPRTGPRLVRSGPLRGHRWSTIDVTSLTNAAPAVSLALATADGRPLALASRESAAPPTLSVQRAPTPVPALPAGIVAPTGLDVPSAPPHPAPVAKPLPGGPRPSSTAPCGVSAAPAVWRHVVWIVMENHSYAQAIGTAGTPYTTALAARCGVATNYWAEARPSLPNYIAMTSGSTQGITDDNPPASHPLDVPSIFSQLGGDWRSLQESMPTNCALTSAGAYAVRHNPAAYYTNVRDSCNALDVPLAQAPDVSARFTFITPNLCNDTHDCGTEVGDAFLAQTVTRILDSAEYRSGTTAVLLTWDEGAGNQHIATIAISPSTRAGTVDGTRYDHSSLLRTTEEMLGLPALGGALTAPSMRGAFGL